MKTVFRKPDNNDPSEVFQIFPKPEIAVLCCRYWWFKNWEITDMARPFWRIYYNPKSGAYVRFNQKEIAIEPNNIYLIPPDTNYSATLFNKAFPENSFKSAGGHLTDYLEELYKNKDYIYHLFIHFTIAEVHGIAEQNIYAIPIDDNIQQILNLIIQKTKENDSVFDLHTTLSMHHLISLCLSYIPKEKWLNITKDSRILDTIKYIKNSLSEDLSNKALAERVNLIPQSFYRLFKHEVGMSPQAYVRKIKINKACNYLHYTNYSIDQIAFECGFNNRHYFSKIFKELIKMPPVRYRKNFMVG